MTWVCATRTEARAARKAGLRASVVGVGARKTLPDGPLVSFGLAGALRDGIACGEVLDATRVVDAQGETLWEGAPLGDRRRAAGRRSSLGTRCSTIPPSGAACTSGRARTPSTWSPARSRARDGSRAACARSPTRRRATLGPLAEHGRRRGSARLERRRAARRSGRATRSGRSRRVRLALAQARRGERVTKKVLLAAPRSFCAGVDRAIEIVERLLEAHGPPIYVRHEIVHNDNVVRRLEALGAVFVDSEDEIPPGEICVLSAHGVAPAVRENCVDRGPARRRRRLPARLEGARRGAPLRRLGPSRRAHRPRRPRRGDRDEGRASRPDRRRRVAGGRGRARHGGKAAGRDQPDDALARRRRLDRRRARRALRRSQAARRRRHLLRDAEPPGRREGDRRPRGNVDSRDRLADELERQPARRGRARRPAREATARRRRDGARRRARRRAHDRRPDGRRVDARGARPGRARRARRARATRRSKRSPSRART